MNTIFENNDVMMVEFRKVATELGYELLYEQDKINPHYPSKDGTIICLFDNPYFLPVIYTNEGLLNFGSNVVSVSELKETFLEWLLLHFETEEIRPHKTPPYNSIEYHCSRWGPKIRIIGRK